MAIPFVSVRMITYNHAAYISQAIDSILQQNVSFPFELIIGEDCSTDGTRDIVFDYAKKYPGLIRLVTSEKNVGMKKNSIRANNLCRGKYLALCEGDDYWHHPDKLKKQVDYLESNLDCGLVCSDFDNYFVEEGVRVRSVVKKNGWKVPVSRDISDFLLGHGGVEGNKIGGSMRTCTVMARKVLIDKVQGSDYILYKSDRFMMGDVQLFAEINMLSKIGFIPESLATYNILPESASWSKNVEKRLKFIINGLDMRLYLCDKYTISGYARKRIEHARLATMLRLAFVSGDARMAEDVKKGGGLCNIKDWLKYFIAKNSVFYKVPFIDKQLFR